MVTRASTNPDVFYFMLQKTAINEVQLIRKYHIVFPTYRRLPILLDDNVRDSVQKLFEIIFINNEIKVITYKILTDHVHILIEKQKGQLLPFLLNRIKGISTYEFFINFPEFKIDIGRSKLWAKGYHYSTIQNDNHLRNTIKYINNNFDKYKDCSID